MLSETVNTIVIPRSCPFDSEFLTHDPDGSLSDWGFEVWYCEVCGWVELP